MQTCAGQEVRECPQKKTELIAAAFFELSCNCKTHTHTHTDVHIKLHATITPPHLLVTGNKTTMAAVITSKFSFHPVSLLFCT